MSKKNKKEKKMKKVELKDLEFFRDELAKAQDDDSEVIEVESLPEEDITIDPVEVTEDDIVDLLTESADALTLKELIRRHASNVLKSDNKPSVLHEIFSADSILTACSGMLGVA